MYALSHHNEGLPASGELPATRAPRFNGTVISFASGEEVVGAGDPTKNYFRVIRGLFRAVNFHAGRTPSGIRLLQAERLLRPRTRRNPPTDDRGGGLRGDDDSSARRLPASDER